jgi:hypothetical protein
MKTHRAIFLILALSVLLRIGVAIYLGNDTNNWLGGTADQISYDALAARVAAGYGFSFAENWWPYARANQPTAFWSYLYTAYLVVVYFLFDHNPLIARLIQAVLTGLLMPWLTFRLGQRLFGPPIGLLGAAIAAIYFYFVLYGASLMTEALYIVGILWTLDAAARLGQALQDPGARPQRLAGLELGLAWGVTTLLRQVFILFVPFLALWLLWVALRAGRLRPAAGRLAAALALLALLLAPWMARNYQVFGRLTLPNTNAGFTIFWSNHPVYGTRFVPAFSAADGVSYQALIPEELRHLNEAELDRALLREGLAIIQADPARYLLLSLSRIPVYFIFWPTSDSTLLSNLGRVFSFGLFLPFMAGGLLMALNRLRPTMRSGRQETGPFWAAGVWLLLLFMFIYTGIHLASWANVRYRLPVDAVLILFAAYALGPILAKLRQTSAVQRLAPKRLAVRR